MPELPEVETVRRGLAPAAEGARVTQLVLRRKNLRFEFDPDLRTIVEGQKIIALARRAKYLLWHMEDGHVLISHLGMSGSFRIIENERGEPGPHDHVDFVLAKADGGRCTLAYNDPRRFGFMVLAAPDHWSEHPLIRTLGMEPTGNELDGDALSQMMAMRRGPIKTALLDQKLIAGLGNIYVCEALWRAQIAPTKPAQDAVKPMKRAEQLAGDIRSVIAEAIAAGGSSLRDHKQVDGNMGYFQHAFDVYGRQGEACKRAECPGVIERLVQSGRSSFWCPGCQK